MSKWRVLITLNSKSLYWTLFCPKYCARAEGAESTSTAAAATANIRRARRGEGIGGAPGSSVSRRAGRLFLMCRIRTGDALSPARDGPVLSGRARILPGLLALALAAAAVGQA